MGNSPYILDTSLKCFFKVVNEAEEQEERNDLEFGGSAVLMPVMPPSYPLCYILCSSYPKPKI